MSLPQALPTPGLPYLDGEQGHRIERATMAVYAGITLIGVVAAASWKGIAEDAVQLITIVVGASATVVLAHAWAAVVAHRLVQRVRFTRSELVDELSYAASFFVTTAIAVGAIVVGTVLTLDLDLTVLITLGVLVATMFVIGLVGARRSGAGWVRAVGWGLLDAGIGLIITIGKVLIG